MRDEKCRQERVSHSGSLGKDSWGQRPCGLKVSRACALPNCSLHRDFPFPEATDASGPDFPLAKKEPVPQTQNIDDSSPLWKKGIILSLTSTFPSKGKSGPQVHSSIPLKERVYGTSLVLQWLRLCAPSVGATGLSPAQGTNILYAIWHSHKKKKKKREREKERKLKGVCMGKKERERNIDDYIRKPHFLKDYSPLISYRKRE